jgi:hypothetical protein
VETTVRIIFLVMVCVLAGCSPGGRSRERAGGREAAATPGAPTQGASTQGAPTPGAAVPSPPAVDGGGRVPSPPGSGAHTVTFAIRGSVRRVSVTYALSGGPKRRAIVTPPWSRTFTVADGQSVEVSAHGGGGELTCTLRVDGDLVKSATSSGDSATVDCGDELGF